MDMIFPARQLQGKCQEQRCDLYTTFVDLTKVFDTVSRDGLWKILPKYGCPEKIISIVQQFHDGMRAHVQDNGDTLEALVITNGVKQGCILAPILFYLMFWLCYRMHFITLRTESASYIGQMGSYITSAI